MPTQIPRIGRPSLTRSCTSVSARTSRTPVMQAANAPTPGSTTPSASYAEPMAAVTMTSAPTRSRARSAERRFPEPWSTTTTLGRLAAIGLQHALGRRHPDRPRVERDSLSKRTRDGLELRLDDVVRVAPAEHADVQADLCARGDRLPDVAGQRRVI